MNHPTSLPPEPSGNSKETTWFRQLLKNIRERSIKVGPGLRASYKLNETLIELAKKEASSGTEEVTSGVQRFRVDSIHDHYLTCRKSDDLGQPIGSTTYRIAKPWPLQVESEGPTFVTQNTRRRYILTYYVNEEIDPAYYVGDSRIFATMPTGKDGTIEIIDGELVPLEWIDLNNAARHWRASYTEVRVCVDEGSGPVTRRIFLAGGPHLP